MMYELILVIARAALALCVGQQPPDKIFSVGLAAGQLSRAQLQDRMEALGLRGERVSVDWSAIERARGRRDWSAVDSVIAALTRDGLQAIGLLIRTPAWARPPGTPRQHRPLLHGSTKAGDAAFAAFAAAAARRYAGRVDVWEVWNEPNSPGWWVHVDDSGVNLGPAAADYAALFLVTRDSVLRANPRSTVVSAGLAYGGGRGRTASDPLDASRRFAQPPAQDFLRQLLATGFHAANVGLHVYRSPSAADQQSTNFVRVANAAVDSAFAVLDGAGAHDTRLWITEWGVNASGRPKALVSTWIRGVLWDLLCRPRVALVAVYGLTPTPRMRGYSLVDSAGTPTFSGNAVAEAAKSARTHCS